MKSVGAFQAASILRKAIDVFPDGIVARNMIERRELINKISDEAAWEEIDEDFYTYPDDLNTLNIEYVKSNMGGF